MVRRGLEGHDQAARIMSIHLRCTKEEYNAFSEAAEKAGYSMNSFIRSFVHDQNLLDTAIYNLKVKDQLEN